MITESMSDYIYITKIILLWFWQLWSAYWFLEEGQHNWRIVLGNTLPNLWNTPFQLLDTALFKMLNTEKKEHSF